MWCGGGVGVGVHSKLGVQNLLRSQTGFQSKPFRGGQNLSGWSKPIRGVVKTYPGDVQNLSGGG